MSVTVLFWRTFLMATNILLLLLNSEAATAQRVSGKVRSANGDVLADAIVSTSGGLQDTKTDRTGLFRLELPNGTHMLLVRRVGYMPASVSVSVSVGSQIDTLDIVLAPATAELKGLLVSADRRENMALMLSSETLQNAPALGESDVIRSLPLLPGISQPNDVIDVIHLAGGASDEAAITLAGFPLQAPFHAGNVFGAINVAALSRTSVLMNHIPAGSDGYLSGEIALVPRVVSSKPTRNLVVSLLSASTTITQPIGKRFDVLLSGRTTYIDHLLSTVSPRSARDDLGIPTFRDLLVQFTSRQGDSWTWDLLSYGMGDAAKASRDRPGEQPTRMGESLFGAHVGYARNDWNAEIRLSVDRNNARGSQTVLDSDGTLSIRDNVISQRWITGEMDIGYTRNRWRLHGGAVARVRKHVFRWTPEFVDLAINTPVPSLIDTTTSQSRLGLSGEAAFAFSSTASFTAGSHLSVVNRNAYPAPRLAFDWKPIASVEFEAALNRRYQFDGVAGVPRKLSVTQPVFFLDRPRRADVAAFSMAWEAIRPASMQKLRVSWSIFDKLYRDRTLLQLTDDAMSIDAVDSSARVPITFTRGTGNARGITLSVEAATNERLNVYAAYTGEQVRESYNGDLRPSAWDIPHQLSVYASWSLSRRLSFNTAFQSHSGPAATPILYRVFVPVQQPIGPGFLQGFSQRYVYGEPNSARFPGYRRIDASLGYAWRSRQSDWKLSLQVVNMFDRVNGLDYHLPSYLECVESRMGCVDQGASRRSLPVVPSLSLDVRW